MRAVGNKGSLQRGMGRVEEGVNKLINIHIQTVDQNTSIARK